MSTQVKRAARPVKPKAINPTAAPVEAAPTLAPTPDATDAPAMTAATDTPTPAPAPVVADTTSTASTVSTADSANSADAHNDETVAAVATTTAAEPAATNKRQQTSKAIGVSISSARVRRHIDKLNLNCTIDTLISEFKEKIASFKSAKTALDSGKLTVTVEQEVETDGKKTKQSVEQTRDITDAERAKFQATVDSLSASVATFEMKVAALSRERTRFSNEASIALSIICDELIQQLTEHTMNRVLAAKKKIIQISHLHEAGVERLSLYPLIKSLPSFVATSEKLAAESKAESQSHALAAALAQAEKDFKKKYAVHMPKKKKAVEVAPADAPAVAQVAPQPQPEPAAEPEVADEPEDDSSDSKTSFRFYVGQVCKEAQKKDPRFKAVRVSTEIRGYLSDLLVELIQRLSALVHLTATCMKNKTINGVAVLRTVEALLIDGHVPVEMLEFKEALIPDPAVVKAESAKRDEEKKAGRDYKVDVESIPKVQGLVAVRTITYPTSGYAALAAKAQEKLDLYGHLFEKEKAAEAV